MNMQDLDIDGYERVVRVTDAAAGLTGFIAVHSTRFGPAVGGLRMRPYADEDAALTDVLRLSRGMTYKNAAADLPLGGGKSVIIGDPATDKTEARLMAFGEAIEALGGTYWTAEDMGMTPADLEIVARATRHVAGLATGEFASGDPSPVTARGVYEAARVTLRHATGSDDPARKRIALQGLGNVGRHLAGLFAEAGARLWVADMDKARVDEAVASLGATPVDPQAIYDTEADLFAPNAIGGILNEGTIPRLRVRAICGSANNQLATPEDGARLVARGILYAPDYVVNAGGIINAATEILRIRDRAPFTETRLAAISEFLDRAYARARADGIGPEVIADRLVEEKLAAPPADAIAAK